MNQISEKEFKKRWEIAYHIPHVDYKIKQLVKRIATLSEKNEQSVSVHNNRVALVCALLKLMEIDFVVGRIIGNKYPTTEIRPKALSDYRLDREEKEENRIKY